MATLLIFDSFGVLAGEIAPRFFRNHFEEEEAMKLKNRYFQPGDAGVYSYEEILSLIAKDFKMDPRLVESEFRSYYRLNLPLLDWIKERKGKGDYLFCLLSNCCRGLIEEVYASIKLEDYFDEIIFSYQEKMIKPDPAIYRLALKRCQEKGGIEEAYMIDDQRNNIEGAKRAGLEAILFTGNESVIAKFR